MWVGARGLWTGSENAERENSAFRLWHRPACRPGLAGLRGHVSQVLTNWPVTV